MRRQQSALIVSLEGAERIDDAPWKVSTILVDTLSRSQEAAFIPGVEKKEEGTKDLEPRYGAAVRNVGCRRGGRWRILGGLVDRGLFEVGGREVGFGI